MTLDLERTAWELSSPYEDERSLTAARRLLARSDLDAILDPLYLLLARRRGLRAALAHLERAGEDLGQLRISASHYSSVRENALWRPVPEAVDGKITLRDVRERLEQHFALLTRESTTVLSRFASDRVVLLFGRAFQAAHPEYRHRINYDTDLFVIDLDHAFGLLPELRLMGYSLHGCKVWRPDPGGLGALTTKRWSAEGHSLSIGIMAGGFHFYQGPVWERSRVVFWEGLTVRIPSPEDLLLMIATRLQLKKRISYTDFTDARFLAGLEEGLDWSYLCQQGWQYGTNEWLHFLLSAVARENDRLLPSEALACLAKKRKGRQADSPPIGAPTEKILRHVRARRWLWRYAKAKMGTTSATRQVAGHLISRLVFRAQYRLVRHLPALGRILWTWVRRLRPRYGSLCELRSTRLHSGEFCLSDRFRRPESSNVMWQKMASVADRIPVDPHAAQHCFRYVFDLSPIYGVPPQPRNVDSPSLGGKESDRH